MKFMATKKYFLFFLFCLFTFYVHSEGNYIKNPGKELDLKDLAVTDYKSIPISVFCYNDETASLECGDLDEVEFESVSPSFYPGF